MQMDGISHITFIVRNLERAKKFFCAGLGAVEVYDSVSKNYSVSREKFFVLGGIWLVVMEGEPPAERTYRHLAFKASNEELLQFKKRLLSIGVEIEDSRPRVEGEANSLYFYDFDNHFFEIHTGTLEDRLRRYATGK